MTAVRDKSNNTMLQMGLSLNVTGKMINKKIANYKMETISPYSILNSDIWGIHLVNGEIILFFIILLSLYIFLL